MSGRFGFGTVRPNEPARPQTDLKADLIPNRMDRNISIIEGALTPENQHGKVTQEYYMNKHDTFWVDDNEQQNPVNKLVNNVGIKIEPYRVPMIRVSEKEIPILDERFPHQFEEQVDVLKDERPKNFEEMMRTK